MKFKVGDQVRVIAGFLSGSIGEITGIDLGSHFPYRLQIKERIYFTRDEDIKLVNRKQEKGIMQKLTARLKRALNSDLQAMYKLGWIDGDLEVTEKGEDALTDFIFDHFEKEMGALAKTRVKELEKESK